MKQSLRRVIQSTAAVALAALTLSLTGCTNFFICAKSSCSGGSGGNTPAGNVAYATNGAASTTTVSGYSLGTGTTSLTPATGAPFGFSYVPQAIAISPKNGFLYAVAPLVNASTPPAIYGYSIGSGGKLTAITASALVSLGTFGAMDISPDGNWLIVSSINDPSIQTAITVYPLSPTSGLLGSGTQTSYNPIPPLGSIVKTLKVAPSGDFISVALGTGGVATFPFATSSGALGAVNYTPIAAVGGAITGANDLAIDTNNNVYIAATNAVYVLPVSTSGIPTTSSPPSTPTDAGGPFSVALDGTSYLYASASPQGDSTAPSEIFGFSIGTGGTLTPTMQIVIPGPPATTKLAVDSTGAYLLALGYDSSVGINLYSITPATGTLSSLASAATGTSTGTPASLALTH